MLILDISNRRSIGAEDSSFSGEGKLSHVLFRYCAIVMQYDWEGLDDIFTFIVDQSAED